MGSQEEWEIEGSWRRIFCALNETLSPVQLKRVVIGFLKCQGRFVGRADLERMVNDGDVYYAVALTLMRFKDGELRWVAYVRANYPDAPAGFEDIGRMANAPKSRPSDAPARRINVRGPAHSDEGLAD